ncbi:MAG: GyrI-like domain-containing protein [Oscillospiraceae bacterium]
MGEKMDFKKEYSDLYLPGKTPAQIQVPPIAFLTVAGQGAPESAAYQNAVSVLYAVAFTIKMSKMGGSPPHGYFEYVVPPLEGLWDGDVPGPGANRDGWRWTSLLRQPAFVTPALAEWARTQAARKKPQLDFSPLRFETYEEGLCVQAMHTGPYSTEPETLENMRRFCAQNNLAEDLGPGRLHHEIYISDPRRTAPEKLKTVLRHPVRSMVP